MSGTDAVSNKAPVGGIRSAANIEGVVGGIEAKERKSCLSPERQTIGAAEPDAAAATAANTAAAQPPSPPDTTQHRHTAIPRPLTENVDRVRQSQQQRTPARATNAGMSCMQNQNEQHVFSKVYKENPIRGNYPGVRVTSGTRFCTRLHQEMNNYYGGPE